MLSIFNQFSLRFILRRKGKSLTTIFGITLGIILIVATTIVNRSIIASYKDMVTSLAGKAQLQVLPASNSGFSDGYLDVIEEVEGIDSAYPVVTGNTRVVKDSKDVDSLVVYGVDVGIDKNVRDYKIKEGRFIKSQNSEVLLTEQWAKDNRVNTGEMLELLTAGGLKSFKIVGLISNQGAGSVNNGRLAYINLKSAQQMFSRNGRYDQIDLILRDGFEEEEIKNELEKVLKNKLVVERPANRGKDVEDSLQTFTFMLSFTGAISLLVGLFIVFNNMERSVEERRYSIALLHSLGLRRRKLLTLVLAEAAILGLIGGILGTFIGISFAISMAKIVTNVASATSRISITQLGITPGNISLGIIIGPMAAVLAAIGPAYRILKISPLEALAPLEISQEKRSKFVLISGYVILVIGLVALIALSIPKLFIFSQLTAIQLELIGVFSIGLLILGVVVLLPSFFKSFFSRFGSERLPIRVASDNLSRSPGRTSAAVAGVMVALTMMIGLYINYDSLMRYTTEWIDKTFGWDMIVSSSFFGNQVDVPIDEEIGKELHKTKEIENVTAFRFTSTNFEGTKVGLNAFDMKTLLNFITFNILSGDEQKFSQRMRSGKYVAISSITARKFDIKPGENIHLTTPKGKMRFTVAAIIKDYGLDTGVMYIDRPTYESHWEDKRVDGYEFVVKPGYSVNSVKNKIKNKFGKNRHITINTKQEFRENVLSLMNQSMSMTFILVIIAIFVAAFGIMNTALISVWQRKRELSTLMALGSRKKLINRILLNEAIVIGVFGAIFGTIIGIVLGKVMVESSQLLRGITLDFQIPWLAILLTFLFVIILSAISSIIPGRVASNSNIIEGIRYE